MSGAWRGSRALAERDGERRWPSPCNVTVETQVQRLYDTAVDRARALRRGRATTPGWAGSAAAST